MIYGLFEGFSEGFWTDFTKEEIDENFAKRGITIFHTSHGTRRIFIDDTVNEFEANVCRSRRDAKQADPDCKSLYEKTESVYGYGSLHPYYEEKSRRLSDRDPVQKGTDTNDKSVDHQYLHF